MASASLRADTVPISGYARTRMGESPARMAYHSMSCPNTRQILSGLTRFTPAPLAALGHRSSYPPNASEHEHPQTTEGCSPDEEQEVDDLIVGHDWVSSRMSATSCAHDAKARHSSVAGRFWCRVADTSRQNLTRSRNAFRSVSTSSRAAARADRQLVIEPAWAFTAFAVDRAESLECQCGLLLVALSGLRRGEGISHG